MAVLYGRRCASRIADRHTHKARVDGLDPRKRGLTRCRKHISVILSRKLLHLTLNHCEEVAGDGREHAG